MSDELQAAAERYEKHKAAKSTGDSPYHVIEDGARFTNLNPMLDDLRTLADAYLALGERKPDEFAAQRRDGGYVGVYTLKHQSDAEMLVADCEMVGMEGVKLVRVSTFIHPLETP